MATLTYTSREEIEVHKFSPLATVGIPLLAIFFQAYVSKNIHFLQLFDVPLVVTIFFAVARRNQIAGTLTGCVIGLVQDSLTHLPIGMFGISKSIIGYAASSIGTRIDVDSPGPRFLMVFAFTLLHNLVYYLVRINMVRLPMEWHTGHQLLEATANALLAVFLFALMDRAKKRM